jgi:hypothetical protein
MVAARRRVGFIVAVRGLYQYRANTIEVRTVDVLYQTCTIHLPGRQYPLPPERGRTKSNPLINPAH